MRGEFVEAEWERVTRGRFEGASLFNPTSVGKYGRQIKDFEVKILQRAHIGGGIKIIQQ